jgi:hypothetical protein
MAGYPSKSLVPRSGKTRSFADTLVSASTPVCQKIETPWDAHGESAAGMPDVRSRQSGHTEPRRRSALHAGAKRTSSRPVKVLLADDHPVVRSLNRRSSFWTFPCRNITVST